MQHRRPKGEGSITTLPNGKLKMTISIGVDAEGKQRRKSVTAATKAELLKKVAELRLRTGLGESKSIPYFHDLIEEFLREKEATVSDNTYDSYKRAYKSIFEPLSQYRLDRITAIMIDNLLDSLKKEDGSLMEPSSIRLYRKQLATFFNWAVAKDYITKSPMKGTRKRPLGELKVNRVIIPSDSQMKEILKDSQEYDKCHPKGAKLYPLFLLAISTGMRFGELLGLRPEDVDLTRNTVDVNKQRTKFAIGATLKTRTSYRRIFVQPMILREVLKETNGDLWRHETYRAVQAKVVKFFMQCDHKPEGFSFHCFRHYHATKLLLSGIDIKEVSKRLGHASIKTTLDLYAHWMPEMDQKAANSISADFIIK